VLNAPHESHDGWLFGHRSGVVLRSSNKVRRSDRLTEEQSLNER